MKKYFITVADVASLSVDNITLVSRNEPYCMYLTDEQYASLDTYIDSAALIVTSAEGYPAVALNAYVSSPLTGSNTLNHAAAQTAHELVPAPGPALSLYITDIIISNGPTAGTILFMEDTTDAATTLINLTYLGINSNIVINLKTPVKITVNKNFGFTSATISNHTVTASYYIA